MRDNFDYERKIMKDCNVINNVVGNTELANAFRNRAHVTSPNWMILMQFHISAIQNDVKVHIKDFSFIQVVHLCFRIMEHTASRDTWLLSSRHAFSECFPVVQREIYHTIRKVVFCRLRPIYGVVSVYGTWKDSIGKSVYRNATLMHSNLQIYRISAINFVLFT